MIFYLNSIIIVYLYSYIQYTRIITLYLTINELYLNIHLYTYI